MSSVLTQHAAETGPLPRHVVALGGGTGLPAVLRGLRRFAVSGEMTDLIAVVAMSDDGGSSGRLRRGRGLPPPGDVRNCLLALSEEEDLLAAEGEAVEGEEAPTEEGDADSGSDEEASED